LNPLKTEIPFARDGLFCPGGVRAKMLNAHPCQKKDALIPTYKENNFYHL